MKPVTPTYPSETEEVVNPLGYFPEFVARPVKPSEDGVILARDENLFTASRAMIYTAKDNIPLYGTVAFKKEEPVAIARTIQNWLKGFVEYDDNRKISGIRSAAATFTDRRGHCLEKNSLYYALLRNAGVDAHWIIGKNPVGYKFDGPFGIGFHPFLKFKQGKDLYFTDFASPPVIRKSLEGFCATSADVSESEMVGILLGDGADDFILNKQYPAAEKALDQALLVDPNNYTLHVSRAELFWMTQEIDRAKKAFGAARAIAPACGDIDKAEGDLELYYEENESRAVNSYKRALGKKSRDAFLFLDMARRLRAIGSPKLAREAERKFIRIGHKEKIRTYLGEILSHIPPQAKEKGLEATAAHRVATYTLFEPAFQLIPIVSGTHVENLKRVLNKKKAMKEKKSAKKSK